MPINRREILMNSGRLAAAATLSAATRQTAAQDPPRKLKVLIAGGHPGDPEYGCGGAIARLTAAGHQVVLLYMNDGAWETSAPVRIAEARKACEILKAHPVWAGQANGHSIVDDAHYTAFQKIVEDQNPDAVFNHWPIDNHPDHRAISNLIYEAWNRLKRRFPMYYYEVSSGEDTMQFPVPTHYIDISSVADTKKAACYAHASQNPAFFYDLQDSVARFRGLDSGYKRAEAYVLQVGSPHDIFPQAGLSG
ncbi:MAG TPA: PIG-L deacetylase family protein [Terracidiphilus sp.]|jgi:LmbE family N-acetylglucosaminyl deacetylase